VVVSVLKALAKWVWKQLGVKIQQAFSPLHHIGIRHLNVKINLSFIEGEEYRNRKSEALGDTSCPGLLK